MKDHPDDPFWEMILIGIAGLLLFFLAFMPAWNLYN
jgi:hypothetical protein